VNREIQLEPHLAGLRRQLRQWRQAGEDIGLVPTMGNLHDGHLELVRQARERCDRLVVSVFVNPLQFAAGEDFESYPRTLGADQQALRGLGVDLLFAPGVEEVYPRGEADHTRVEVPGISAILCGASRPGHFIGVATVVCKLLNMVQPDLAVFGEKDFQQLLVIRRMVEDLAMPVRILGVATVREADGLAMSSRNGYLSSAERRIAPRLYASLRQAAGTLRGGAQDYPEVERQGLEALRQAGFIPDYFVVRRSRDLAQPQAGERELVVLTAATLGRARLIDNLRVSG